MAGSTLSCPWLRWSCWAWRQAGPWVRKMSATSRVARPTPTPLRLRQSLKGTDHLGEQLAGHARVGGCGLQILVPAQYLYDADTEPRTRSGSKGVQP